MRKFSYFMLMLCTLAACTKGEGTLYKEKSDDGKEIHFLQKAVTKEFSQGLSEGTILVDIARPGKTGTYAVWLNLVGDDKARFTVPGKVEIKDGEYSTPVPIKVDLASLMVGSDFKASLYIYDREAPLGPDATWDTQFADKIDIKVSFALEWEEFTRVNAAGETVRQTATYHYNAFYNGNDGGLTVDKAVGANIFRVNDWASGVSFRFILNDDNTCVVPAQSIGFFNSNYNEYVQVSDMAVYTGNKNAYASYPCTYDGKGKFTFNLIYFVTGGYFAKGEETLTFDGEEDTTATVKIVYDGIQHTETGFAAPQFTFIPGEYTKQYKVAFVEGNITEDKNMLKSVRNALIADREVGVVKPRTFYAENTDLWNIPQGNYTVVALAYNEEGEPEKELHALRFTSDPVGVLAPKVTRFNWYCPSDNPLYDPYGTLLWELRCENAAKVKYLCVRADVLDLLLDLYDQTLAEYVDEHGNQINETYTEEINSPEGLNTGFNGMASGCGFTLCVLAYNEYGDTVLVSKTAYTLGHKSAEFDTNVTLDNFIGAFRGTATVTNSEASAKNTEEYRVDIYRQGPNSLTIKGLSNTRDYNPEVTGFYDAEHHCIVIEPQSLGTYKGNSVKLGFTDDLSIYWGGTTNMALGFIGGKLYLLSGPSSANNVTSYMFLLFDAEGQYMRKQVAYKTYSGLTLEKI
ncbi:MAG: hypothetical protein IKI85_02025 [Bacteroidales bacterium]|nr:hypothetical protein [Bacteroidales bacterium]